MDIDGDGHLDILSGSYSRQDRDMAGLFQVMYGKGDGTFRKPEVLKGTDGQPLIITETLPTGQQTIEEISPLIGYAGAWETVTTTGPNGGAVRRTGNPGGWSARRLGSG